MKEKKVTRHQQQEAAYKPPCWKVSDLLNNPGGEQQILVYPGVAVLLLTSDLSAKQKTKDVLSLWESTTELQTTDKCIILLVWIPRATEDIWMVAVNY